MVDKASLVWMVVHNHWSNHLKLLQNDSLGRLTTSIYAYYFPRQNLPLFGESRGTSRAKWVTQNWRCNQRWIIEKRWWILVLSQWKTQECCRLVCENRKSPGVKSSRVFSLFLLSYTKFYQKCFALFWHCFSFSLLIWVSLDLERS